MRLVKREIIEAELSNRGHRHGYDYYPLAWNVRPYRWSWSDDGRISKISGLFGQPIAGYDNDPKWDDKWQEYLNDNDLFWNICSDWWLFFDDNNIPISSFGRSGGWAVLTEFEGCSLFRKSWEDFTDPEYWTYQELWRLFKLVKEIDDIQEGIPFHMEHNYAFERMLKEEEWNMMALEEEAANDLPIGGEMIYASNN